MERNKTEKTHIYPATFEAKIGFDAVRRMVAAKCTSTLARTHVDEMAFTADVDDVRRRLGEVHEMTRALGESPAIPLDCVTDTAPWLASIRVPGTFIDTEELSQLRSWLKSAADVRAFFDSHIDEGTGSSTLPFLHEASQGIDGARPVTVAINAVLTDHGEIKDNASAELREIRRQLSSIGGRINSAMRRVLANAVSEGLVDPDVTPAMRDGRLVIPVAPMNKRRIQGIVHDESASGKTYFIEPAEVVELNNRQRELEIEERREVVRILTVTADAIRPYIDPLTETCRRMGYLDFVRAKAMFAIDTNASLPTLSDSPELEWYTARHPVLEASLARHGRAIVPLSIHLTVDRRLLVISGPNAGGKSVTLKTVGIIQYMMQCGLLPTFYENSRMGIFDNILADIGDDQSLEDDLSTYSSHLRNMNFFLRHGNARSLILIDEFGSGTEPQIGGAIAQALLSRFNAAGMWGVITTHYQNLKTFADETPGLVNGSMLYDRNRMQPLFQLAIGHAGSSFAIEIARKTGLPDDVIDDAREIVGSDYVNLDKYLLDVARDRRYWENKRDRIRQREKHLEDVISRYEADAETLRASRRSILAEARQQAADIIRGSNAAIERTIHDIRQAQAEKEATLEARRNLVRQAGDLEDGDKADSTAPEVLRKAPRPKKPKAAPAPAKAEPIAVGDNVILDNSGNPGTVLEIEKTKATVAFGAMKLTVPLKRLTRTLRKPQTGVKSATFVSAATVESSRRRQLDFKGEIDVRGMRADEAIQAVQYFIDDAIQFNQTRVRILHGTGTGALRQAIRQYLGTIAAIRDYHDEDVRFGGAGITVVEF